VAATRWELNLSSQKKSRSALIAIPEITSLKVDHAQVEVSVIININPRCHVGVCDVGNRRSRCYLCEDGITCSEKKKITKVVSIRDKEIIISVVIIVAESPAPIELPPLLTIASVVTFTKLTFRLFK
jgi:hypothetical protein